MHQPEIALDLDGVVANFHQKLAATYNARYPSKKPLTVADFDSGLESLGSPIYERLIEIFNEPDFFRELEPLPGAIETVTQFLDADYDTVICTAPARIKGLINGQSAAEKFDWVQRVLPFWGNDLVITKHKERVNADMLIDDYPPNIVNWCEKHPNGIGYLVDQPWNQYFNQLPANSVRCDLIHVNNLIDTFWCQQRGQFVYRYNELSAWHKQFKA